MPTSNSVAAATEPASRSLWSMGWQRLRRDHVGYTCLWIVGFFIVLATLVWTGLLAHDWDAEVGQPNTPPVWAAHEKLQHAAKADEMEGATGPIIRLSPAEDPIADMLAAAEKNKLKYETKEIPKTDELVLGSDQRGHSVMQKVLQGTATSMLVGIFGALLSVALGTVLGAFAGYFGGKTDDFLMWFYSVFTSVPDMLLLLAFAAVAGRGFTTLILVLSFTSWTGVFRLVRAEYMKQRSREYVQAADAIGASHLSRMFVHILPNISHLLLVQFSLLLVGLIKYEVILSFLGFGVGVKQVSWGSILGEVPTELMQGYWWQLLGVVIMMSALVTAVSMLTDALRDALDPKLR